MAPTMLEDLPTEVRLDICHHLDVESVFKLAQVNRSFSTLIQSNRSRIILPILERDFSPLDELLQVFTACDADIYTHGHTYQPRRVVFRRGASHMAVLAKGGFTTPSSGGYYATTFKPVRNGSRPSASEAPLQTVVLNEFDVDDLLKYCLVVKQWEELFPHLRWIKHPAYCRFLEAHEQHRFRRALYRWWLYAFYFHGELPRPLGAQPYAFVDDIRISQMRMYSTAELIELLDLLTAVFHLVQNYICPTLEQNLAEDCWNNEKDVSDAEVRWNDQTRLGRVIRTYTKLDPKELVHYFESIYSYPKKRLIADVHLNHPCFLDDQESLQAAIRSALEERHWLGRLPVPTDVDGGIVDFEDDSWELDLEKLGADGSWNGSLPEAATYVRSYPMYNPRGDDGSGSDAWSYPTDTEPSNRLALEVVS